MLKLHSEDINETGCNWHISEQSPAPQKFSSTFALTSSKVCFVLIHKIKIEPQSGDGTIGSETAAGTGVGAIEEESQDANSRGARQEANEDQRSSEALTGQQHVGDACHHSQHKQVQTTSETAAGTGVGAIEEESQDANSRGARQEANEDQRKPLRFATCRGHAHLHSTALSLEMGASCRWRMPPQPTPAGWSCAPWVGSFFRVTEGLSGLN
eukprot:s65_g21.t2